LHVHCILLQKHAFADVDANFREIIGILLTRSGLVICHSAIIVENF